MSGAATANDELVEHAAHFDGPRGHVAHASVLVTRYAKRESKRRVNERVGMQNIRRVETSMDRVRYGLSHSFRIFGSIRG